MLTASLTLLLLLAASSFAQNKTPLQGQGQGQGATALGDGSCLLQGSAITCACPTGIEVLSLTASSMAGGGEAEALEVSGCSSVTLAFPPLQRLQTVLVKHCGSATFQEKASPLLRHLALVNISQVTLQGPVFQGAALETVFLDGVRVSTLPNGAFANLNKIQNVTFRDVHFSAVQQGAMELNMVDSSELTILRSTLLGVEKSGIVVRGVANLTMHEVKLTTVGDNGVQFDCAGPVSVSDSQLQTAGPVKLTLKSDAPFRFLDNVWRNSSLLEVAQQILLSGARYTVARNTFHCACDPTVASLVAVPDAAPLLESNQCDESLCRSPVPMSILRSCNSQSELQAACDHALVPSFVTASTPAGVTGSQRAGKPVSPSTNSTATTITISMTTALLLTVPAAAAWAL